MSFKIKLFTSKTINYEPNNLSGTDQGIPA